MSNLISKCNTCEHPQQFQDFLNSLQADVGTFGGRRLYKLNVVKAFQALPPDKKDSICLNDLVKRLSTIYWQTKTTMTKEEAEQCKTITQKIRALDFTASFKLRYNNGIFIRILTAIKSLIGNIGFNREQVLSQIEKRATQVLDAEQKKKDSIEKQKQKDLEDEEYLKKLPCAELLKLIPLKSVEKSELQQADSRTLKCLEFLCKRIDLRYDTPEPIEEYNQILTAFGNDRQKLLLFADLYIEIRSHMSHRRISDSLFTICQTLESLKWPSEQVKEEILVEAIARRHSQYIFRWKHDLPRDPNQVDRYQIIKYQNAIALNKVVLRNTEVFGGGSHRPISPILAKGLGKAFSYLGGECLKDMKNHPNHDLRFGLNIQINLGYNNQDITGSMLSPLLPYLCHVPGLISLELLRAEIPILTASDEPYINREKAAAERMPLSQAGGFSESDFDNLSKIIETNPHLCRFHYTLDPACPADRSEQFKAKVTEMNTRNPVSLEDALKAVKDEANRQTTAPEVNW